LKVRDPGGGAGEFAVRVSSKDPDKPLSTATFSLPDTARWQPLPTSVRAIRLVEMRVELNSFGPFAALRVTT
jgi:hypothetical protein